VIGYVRQKYGHVAQIITFGRLKAKAAIKDVARVQGLSPADGQRLANLVPGELNITIDAALEREPEFRQQYDSDPTVTRVVDTARDLEGHARHAGVHAAGVVIATRPLEEIVPLGRATGNEDIITQWDGPTCERVGLLKMDFLGLRTLSTIERACQLIRQSLPEEAIRAAVGRGEDGGPHPLDLDRLRYDDQRVLDLFRRADTAGVFQFESGGMRKLLLQMKPDRLEDLIAANALYRPGPMELIPQYCARKHGREPVPEMHPIVARHTAETYGIMVYQEQVMQIVHELGDIPLRRAYTLIKAIGKKNHQVIDAERPRFSEGSRERGLERRHADELFDLILKFAGYGFNKSHSTGYAIIAYQTAYLKTYFPNQYMAALLTYESAARKIDDWVPYLQDCRQTVFPDSTPKRLHVGVVVRPPDLNRSEAEFSVVFDEDEPVDAVHGHVRFGLSAIKGVSKTAIRSIIEQRRKSGSFATIYELCERLGPQVLSKSTLEALVQCGALDSLHGAERRAAMMATIEEALSAGQRAAEDRRRGQMTMFAGPGSTAETIEAPPPRPLPDVPAWDRLSMLAREQQVLGFHVSGHPLDAFQSVIETFCNATAAGALHLHQDAPVVLGGLLTRVQLKLVKRGASSGQKMATISLQDRTGTVSGVVFASVFATSAQHLQESAVVVLVGRMDLRQGEPQVVVDQVLPIEQAPRQLAGTVEIDLDGRGGGLQEQLEMTAGLLQQAHATRGLEGSHPAEVILHLQTAGKRVSLRSRRLRAVADPYLLQQLRELAGDGNVRMTARRNIGGRARR
jgi:DNA polymerase-3 subunit alpha